MFFLLSEPIDLRNCIWWSEFDCSRADCHVSSRSTSNLLSHCKPFTQVACINILRVSVIGAIHPKGSEISAISESSFRFVLLLSKLPLYLKQKTSLEGFYTTPKALIDSFSLFNSRTSLVSRRCDGRSLRTSTLDDDHFRRGKPRQEVFPATHFATSSPRQLILLLWENRPRNCPKE